MRLSQLFSSRDVARIAALQLVARQAVEGLSAGRHRSPHKGSSVEFKEHRQYVAGDELRVIDWKAFGKSDRLFVREYEDETNLRCTLLIDRSGSMAYCGDRATGVQRNQARASKDEIGREATGAAKEEPVSKTEYASSLATAIAYMLLSSQDLVGAMTFDDRLRDVLPLRGRASHLQAIAKVLAARQRGGETDLGTAIRQAAAKLPRRGMVILISDGFGDIASLTRSLATLRSSHQDLIFLQILDPDEVDFPFRERVEFRDLELPDDRNIIDSRSIRDAYIQRLRQHQAEIVSACRKNRVDHALITTDQPLVDALSRFVTLRRDKARGGGRGLASRSRDVAGFGASLKAEER
ncbi:MAG: DUF58 domain-containing protein [Planctomycetota bacterium]